MTPIRLPKRKSVAAYLGKRWSLNESNSEKD